MFEIIHGYTENAINGPYYVLCMKDGRVCASVSGIQSAKACDNRAREYAQSYGAAIKNPFLVQV